MRTLLLLAWLSLSASALSQNLVAYYPFNGNNNDESGNSINPTYTGTGVTLTTDRFGNANKAYYFDGTPGPNYSITGSYMRMPANALPAGNRTISLWFYTNDVSNRPGLLGYGGNGSCGTTLLMGINLLGAGQFHVQGHCGNNTAAYAYTSAPINNWYHWVLTIDGSTQKIYVNGVLKSTDNTFSGTTATAGVDFALGAITHTNGLSPYTDANVGFFQGKLDDIRIYDAAMSDAQVMQLYNTESTGRVAYYPFNGNANDESGNGNHGTVNGATLTTDRFGNVNKAYSFTNPNHIEVPNSNMLGDEFTVSYWFKINSYFGQRGVMSNVAVPNGGFQQAFDGTTFSYILGYNFPQTNDPLFSNYTMQEPLSQWHHLAVTYKKTGTNSSESKLFINGELKKFSTHNGLSILFTPNATFYIGQNHSGLNFQGDLDDIHIYNRNLSPNEIQQLADVPMMPDLIAYLPMNGDANDKSGNNRNGTPYGGAVLTTDKYDNTNSAYSFSGADCGISLANTNSFDFVGQPFAISAWVKYSNITGAPSAVVAKHNCGTPNGYLLGIENNIPQFFMSSNGGWSIISASQTYNDNKWHHLAATYDGAGSQKFYVDGELKSSASVAYNNPAGSGAPIIIGDAAGSCGGGTFSASIDEVKIYGAALDASLVAAIYKKSRGSDKAIKFDGADDYVNLGTGLDADNFTFETWYKIASYAKAPFFISAKNNGGWLIQINNLKYINIAKTGVSSYSVGPIADADNKWHHLAVTVNATTTAFYLDGLLIGSGSYSPGFNSGNGEYSLGGRIGYAFNWNEGAMDEVRIWNTALTQTQIRDWMNKKITADHPAYANLVSYYNFDEQNLFLAYDIKAAKTGTLVNGPQYVTSGAATGDASAYDFTNAVKSATITLPTGENFNATEDIASSMSGISVYLVKDPPENQLGILGLGGNDHYFGVHVSGGSNPQYTAVYDYTGNILVAPVTEPALQLFKRADNSAVTWIQSGATLNTTTNTLTVTGQTTEYILGSSGFALPVTLLSFQVQKLNANTAKITWQTATEANNKGFELQRSFDGSTFITIAFIAGAGNADVVKEYSTTDVPGRTGRVYYRLIQVDFDGNSKLSKIVSVLFDKQGLIKVYPNPAQQQVTIEGVDNYNRVQLLDGSGRMVKEQLNNGQYLLTMNLGGLKSGMYLLRLINGIENQTIKLMIGN